MPEQRILGQDVIVTPFLGGVPQEAVTDIKNFEIAIQLEVIKEGYLGQFTDRRDDVYRGVRGSFEINFATTSALAFCSAITARARRQGANTKIVIQAALLMPNGDAPILITEDTFFNEIPIGFGGRTEFGTIRFDWESDDFRIAG